jgi:hypothetical protein
VNEERARQGVEHLQAAAIEMIAAVRAFLDVAEDVVRDPSTVAALATSLLDAARSTPAADTTRAPGDAGAGEPRVTRIRVS